MKVTLKNNSCGGLRRSYHKFELELKGHATVTINVPDAYVEDLKRYLQKHHPAVEWRVVEEAAASTDPSIVDINVDDEEAGKAGDASPPAELKAPETPEAPAEAQASAEQQAPETPQAPAEAQTPAPQTPEVKEPQQKAPETQKRGGAGNLKPAKPKAAKASGGTK